MTLDYIRTLYRYHDWANDRVLSAVAELSEEQRHTDLKNSFGSIHDTLVHMLASEWVWLARWKGSSPSGMPGAESIGRLDDLRKRWSDLSTSRRAYIGGLQDADVTERVSYRRQNGEPHEQPLWELMCHAANHATYHRGQITTLIRQLGETPVSTDMVAFFRSDAHERAAPDEAVTGSGS